MAVALKVDTSAVKQELPVEARGPTVNAFVNLIHKRDAKAEITDHKYDALHEDFVTLAKMYASVKGEDDLASKFGEFTASIAKSMAEQHPVSSYLSGKEVVIQTKTNMDVEDVDYGFNAEESGHAVKSIVIAVQVGGNARFIKLGDEVHFSTMKPVKEDLSEKVHFLINLQAPASKPAEKTSRFAKLFLPFTWAMSVIKWPFKTTARTVLTLSVLVGVAAWYFGQTPSAETLSKWGTTLQAYTWDKLPTMDVTLECVKAPIECGTGIWNSYFG